MPTPVKIPPNLLFAAYALIVPLALGVLASWDGLRTLKDAPAWIQAIGSVAAIVAAIVIDQGSSRRQQALNEYKDRQQDQARRDAAVMALSNLTDARDYLDRQANTALTHGVVYATKSQILGHARQLQRVEHLAKHYLAVGSGSAKTMAAIAVAASELNASIGLLIALATDRTQAQLLAAEARINDATDAVDEALREGHQ
jgi:hypothetical protein